MGGMVVQDQPNRALRRIVGIQILERTQAEETSLMKIHPTGEREQDENTEPEGPTSVVSNK